MSNYIEPTKHPETGQIEDATWLDNHYGHHRYGVLFPSDGKIFRAEQIDPQPVLFPTEFSQWVSAMIQDKKEQSK